MINTSYGPAKLGINPQHLVANPQRCIGLKGVSTNAVYACCQNI